MNKAILSLALALACGGANAEDLKKLDQLCKLAGQAVVSAESNENFKFWTVAGINVQFSYSPVINTCVGTRVVYLRNEWHIEDVTHGFMWTSTCCLIARVSMYRMS